MIVFVRGKTGTIEFFREERSQEATGGPRIGKKGRGDLILTGDNIFERQSPRRKGEHE